MIRIAVDSGIDAAKAFVVDLGERVVDRKALNQSLAERLAEEIQEHWVAKNAEGNRLGGPRTNFWSKAAGRVEVSEVDENGASVVAVGDESGQSVRIHIFGGPIIPKNRKFLTIPIIREAHGLTVEEYEEEHGEVFRIPGVNVLFQKPTDRLGANASANVTTEGKSRRNNSISLVRRDPLRAVFALSKRSNIRKDPDALPKDAELLKALNEEFDDFLADQEGGLA